MKKLLFGSAFFIGILAVNIIPIQNANSRTPDYQKWFVNTYQCPDGIGTYKKCEIWGNSPFNIRCEEGTSFPYTCNPIE